MFASKSFFVRQPRREAWNGMAQRLRYEDHSCREASHPTSLADKHRKDVVAMPLSRSAKTSPLAPKRARPANPRCRGGASSVLRLAQPAAQRLPTTLDLSDWMSRAASVLMPVTGPLSDLHSRARA